MQTSHFAPPEEPVLELDDIQGIAVPGFFKPYHRLLYCMFPSSAESLRALKRILPDLGVSNGRVTLQDRELHRKRRRASTYRSDEERDGVLCALALSAIGLRKLTPGAARIASPAFQLGLVARSPLLGDPTNRSEEGNPSNWKVGRAGHELDALVVVAGNYPTDVAPRADAVSDMLSSVGVEIKHEDGMVRADLRGHEHFGFNDGVSQPGIRGRQSNDPDSFITERYLAPDVVPEHWLFGYPGQDLVWPGEFVIGYPQTSPDPLVPGTPTRAEPAWTRNGSFLVFRRLRQNVALFWQTMRAEAARLSTLPGFSGMTDVVLASHLVGRWPSGSPIPRVPTVDIPNLGDDQYSNNSFMFDSNTPKPAHREGTPPDIYPDAKADPVGIACPLAAHIRKVNTRDSASDMGARSSTYDRRILRVGVPYGVPPKDPYTDDGEDRGLFFLGIQASIEEQFEFLQARWINDGTRPKTPGGHDMIVGQNKATASGTRQCSIFSPTTLAQATVTAGKQWVTATGGGYFFVPSITAIANVLAR
jgi:Dyp-type peroxidase family